MMGGAPIFIRTNGGLDDMPSLNKVILESQNIAGAFFEMKPVNDDEAFASNSMSGMLAYTVPSLPEIFSTPKKSYNYYDFNDVTLPSANAHPLPAPNLVNFEVTVQNSDE